MKTRARPEGGGPWPIVDSHGRVTTRSVRRFIRMLRCARFRMIQPVTGCDKTCLFCPCIAYDSNGNPNLRLAACSPSGKNAPRRNMDAQVRMGIPMTQQDHVRQRGLNWQGRLQRLHRLWRWAVHGPEDRYASLPGVAKFPAVLRCATACPRTPVDETLLAAGRLANPHGQAVFSEKSTSFAVASQAEWHTRGSGAKKRLATPVVGAEPQAIRLAQRRFAVPGVYCTIDIAQYIDMERVVKHENRRKT
jgi:hypothetical protein